MSDHQNPGTTNPADQSYPAVQLPDLPAPPASAAATTSNGEQQRSSYLTTEAVPSIVRGLPVEVNAGDASQVRYQPPVASATPASGPTATSDGEQQRPALHHAAADACPVRGLPVDVHADSNSHVRAQKPAVAAAYPTATNVQADTRRPGGLPANVYIR